MKIFTLTFLWNFFVTLVLSASSPNDNIDGVNLSDTNSYIKHTSFRTIRDFKKQARIIGGKTTQRNRYLYQVSLINEEIHFCAGTLISTEWVLTAAHCYGYATHVHIGRYNIHDDYETFENIEVDYEIPHPFFDYLTFDYDFMLLKLKEPSSYPSVTLDDGSTTFSKGDDLTVMGWGATSSELLSDELMEVEVEYFPTRKCQRRFENHGAEVTDRMICAHRDGRDACQGDSGGPLIQKGANGSEDIQVGIVSWGIGCASKRLPGVYSLVSEALDFIDFYVSQNNTQ